MAWLMMVMGAKILKSGLQTVAGRGSLSFSSPLRVALTVPLFLAGCPLNGFAFPSSFSFCSPFPHLSPSSFPGVEMKPLLTKLARLL